MTREVGHYNLDMVQALDFWVSSPAGVRFRQWGQRQTERIHRQGFLLDDARLKNSGKGGITLKS